jgi:soluble lytic murein transglycosylase-like protein
VIQIPARGSGSGPSTFTPTRVSEPGVGSVSGATPPAGTTDARVMQWKPQIEAAAQKYGVNPALVAATIEWESGGNPNALSFDGGHGKGLMQIDDRWHAFARQPNALDPAANIDYGTSMIASDLKSFPGNLRAGIAAYNAGVGGVQGALSRGEDPSKATYSPGYIDGIQSSMNRFQQYF